MKISVSMYSLASTIQKENWSILDFIQFAKKNHFDGIELLDFYWTDIKKELPEAIHAIKETNLIVSAYDVSNDFVKASEKERNKEVQKVIEGIYTAKQLGTNIVRTFCGDIKDGLTFEDGQEWIIEGLRQAAKVASEEKVYLAIENHGLLAGRSEQVEAIIQAVDSPYVVSTFDAGNFLLVHESPTHAFDHLAQYIKHVHFKDFREKEAQDTVRGFQSTEGVELIGVVPGDGQVALNQIISKLKEMRYDGFLSIEYEGFDDAKAANIKAKDRLRHLISDGEQL